MKYSYKTLFFIGRLFLFALLFFSMTIQAQVGIGTTTPNVSSILDITSTTQGLLAPRMTTAQRIAIVAPAESLLVFDTTIDAFYFYDTTTSSWIKLANEGSIKRNNYKLVKSVADFPAPSGGKITLDENTLYEINGLIILTNPIELNDAQLLGSDAGEDILFKASGAIFTGTTGGNVKNLTITGGGIVFAITGGTALLFQNCIVSGMASVGTISGVGLYFSNIVQFLSNTTGITYTDIPNLLLNNQGWLGNNGGTYEKFTGTFGLIEKVSGFSTANGTAVALDVSTTGLAVSNGVLIGTVFSGNTSMPYVKKYISGSYAGFNFTNSWTVNSPGIPRENDDVATANLYFESAPVITLTSTTAFKLPVITKSIRLFRTRERAAPDKDNSVVYLGSKNRAINVFGSISFTATAGSRYTFSIRKNDVLVQGTESTFDVLQTNQRQTVSVIGTVDVNPNDYIEIYVQKTTTGTEQFLVTGYNVIVN